MAVWSSPPAAEIGLVGPGSSVSARAVQSELSGCHHCPVTARAGSRNVLASAPSTPSRACRVAAEPCMSSFSTDHTAWPPSQRAFASWQTLNDEPGRSGRRFSRAERRGSARICVASAAAGASDGASFYQTEDLAVGSRREEEDLTSIERSRREEEIDDDDDEGCRVPDDDDITARLENFIEQTIFNCRFLTILAIVGSLAGSLLCFLQGSYYVSHAVSTWAATLLSTRKTHIIIYTLIEAVDVYLMGTVMLIFGCGLHGLFISKTPDGPPVHGEFGILSSSLFGMFRLMSKPSWVKIHSLEEMKTKLGHVIVMILLVGLFEKAKRVPVRSGADLLCLAASICLSSASLFLLSRIAHR